MKNKSMTGGGGRDEMWDAADWRLLCLCLCLCLFRETEDGAIRSQKWD